MFGHGKIKNELRSIRSDITWIKYDSEIERKEISRLYERIRELHEYLGVGYKTVPHQPEIPEHSILVKKPKKRK